MARCVIRKSVVLLACLLIAVGAAVAFYKTNSSRSFRSDLDAGRVLAEKTWSAYFGQAGGASVEVEKRSAGPPPNLVVDVQNQPLPPRHQGHDLTESDAAQRVYGAKRFMMPTEPHQKRTGDTGFSISQDLQKKKRKIVRRPASDTSPRSTRTQINEQKLRLPKRLPGAKGAKGAHTPLTRSPLPTRDPSKPQPVVKSPVPFVSWDRQLSFLPGEVFVPESLAELSAVLRLAVSNHRRLRVIGSFYSMQPLPESTFEMLVSLDKLNAVMSIDEERGTVTAQADALDRRQLGLATFPSAPFITLGGALSTGSHGLGHRDLGSLATLVDDLTLVLANGTVVTCSRTEHPDLFGAAQVSLGLLGVVYAVTLRVAPAADLRLERTHNIIAAEKLVRELGRMEVKHQSTRFAWALEPYGGGAAGAGGEAGASYVVAAISGKPLRACGALPSERVVDRNVRCVDRAHRALASHQLFERNKYVEMEYTVPANAIDSILSSYLEFLDDTKSSRDELTIVTLHASYQMPDTESWLSPAFAAPDSPQALAPVALLSLLVRSRYPSGDPPSKDEVAAVWAEFDRVAHKLEDLCRDAGGRPHWAKHHFVAPEDFATLFPRFEQFADLRRQLDPFNLFLNDYLSPLFLPLDVAAKERLVARRDPLKPQPTDLALIDPNAPNAPNAAVQPALTDAGAAAAVDSKGNQPTAAPGAELTYDSILSNALADDVVVNVPDAETVTAAPSDAPVSTTTTTSTPSSNSTSSLSSTHATTTTASTSASAAATKKPLERVLSDSIKQDKQKPSSAPTTAAASAAASAVAAAVKTTTAPLTTTTTKPTAATTTSTATSAPTKSAASTITPVPSNTKPATPTTAAPTTAATTAKSSKK